jgi:hypothetical protein
LVGWLAACHHLKHPPNRTPHHLCTHKLTSPATHPSPPYHSTTMPTYSPPPALKHKVVFEGEEGEEEEG